jgi:phage baseplate assembly protein W
MATAKDFLGYGIQTPFQRDGKQSFAAAGGDVHLKSKIQQVLTTRIGELQWNPEFGSNLDRLRHMDNDADIEPIARRYTVDALEQWVPEIVVTRFSCTAVSDSTGAETKLAISLGYTLVGQEPTPSTDDLTFTY